jgi:hypothetical protein
VWTLAAGPTRPARHFDLIDPGGVW